MKIMGEDSFVLSTFSAAITHPPTGHDDEPLTTSRSLFPSLRWLPHVCHCHHEKLLQPALTTAAAVFAIRRRTGGRTDRTCSQCLPLQGKNTRLLMTTATRSSSSAIENTRVEVAEIRKNYSTKTIRPHCSPSSRWIRDDGQPSPSLPTLLPSVLFIGLRLNPERPAYGDLLC